MSDYSKQTWVDDDGSGTVGTPFSAARMGHVEDGVKDAAEHQNAGYSSQRPAADAAHKHHIWQNTDTGELYYCNGAAWIGMGRTQVQDQSVQRGASTNTASAALSIAADVYYSQSFVAANDGPVHAISLTGISRAAGVTAGVVQVYLHADNAGKPGAALGWLGSLFLPNDVTTALLQRFAYGNDVPTLVQGTTYHVVLRVAGLLGGALSLTATASGSTWSSADGVTWTAASPGFRFIAYHFPSAFTVKDQSGVKVLDVDALGKITMTSAPLIGGVALATQTDLAPTPTTWPYAANWRRLDDDPAYEVGYWKVGKLVFLKGVIENRVAYNYPIVIGSLPVGYRPAGNSFMFITTRDASGVYSILRLTVQASNGDCQLDALVLGTNTRAIGGLHFLDEHYFRAA